MFKNYRKKPVVVEAVKLTIDNFPAVTAEIGRMSKRVVTVVHNGNNEAIGLRIHTLEGAMTAPFGWWIIRGVKGEMYPCEDEVFHMTYDECVVGEARITKEKPC